MENNLFSINGQCIFTGIRNWSRDYILCFSECLSTHFLQMIFVLVFTTAGQLKVLNIFINLISMMLVFLFTMSALILVVVDNNLLNDTTNCNIYFCSVLLYPYFLGQTNYTETFFAVKLLVIHIFFCR